MFERGRRSRLLSFIFVCVCENKRESQVNIYYAKSFFYIRTKNPKQSSFFSSLFFLWLKKNTKKKAFFGRRTTDHPFLFTREGNTHTRIIATLVVFRRRRSSFFVFFSRFLPL